LAGTDDCEGHDLALDYDSRTSLVDKRYQVFISSTYADLKEERRSVIQTVIEADCIPAGMELFPATDEEQLSFIKRVIDDCDYYLLIIGGRYGSVSQTGISYTEQEYDYAVSRELRVIALIHGNPDEIAFGKSEQDPVLRERLQKFRDKVATGRLVKFWQKPEDLPGLVALSLSKTIRSFPAVGWIRANKAASEDLLNEINELRKESGRLKKALADLKTPPLIDDLAGLDEEVTLPGDYHDMYNRGRRSWNTKTTWREIFAYLSPYLEKYPNEYDVKKTLAAALFARQSTYSGNQPDLDDQSFQTVAVQLRALGLVKITYAPATGMAQSILSSTPGIWSLTRTGEQLMIELRTIRSNALPK
jgi:hypothetical protein